MGERRATLILLLILCSLMVSLPQIGATEWVEVARFTGSGTTDLFICEHVGWRIRWEYIPSSEFAVFNVSTYEVGEDVVLIDSVFKMGNEETSGVSYTHDREGIFYMEISATNTEGFTVIVEDKPENIIYIRADGSIEGTDKIQRDGDVYTLTGDISGGIKVERNFTVIDGAGYTLQGNGEGNGIDLSTRNVTVKNMRIVNFARGIFSLNTNTIIGNYIADCGTGIGIIGGSNNIIKNNTFVNNINPISIAYSGGGHVITENSFIDRTLIIVWLSPEPTVDRNYWSDYNGTDADGDGIGDTPHFRIAGNETIYIDFHPLMEPVPVIPEFPSWAPLLIMLVAVMFVAVIYKRRLRPQTS